MNTKMNTKPILLNLGVIIVFMLALGAGNVITDNNEPDQMETFSLSIREACAIDQGKGFVWEVAAGNRDHVEGGCVWEEPAMDFPVSALMTGSNTGGSVAAGWTQEGIASWYGSKFHDGPTASGETYDMYSMTAAHRDLPFDSLVKVTRLDNNDSVVVRINNRGPFIEGRIIDLSKKAAQELGMKGQGLARVKIKVVQTP